MAAGYIVVGQCVPANAAQGVLLSHMTPGSTLVGVDSYTWWFFADGNNIGKTTFKNNVFFRYETLAIPPGPACDTAEQFTDGMILGWGVVSAMVAAYAFTLIRRAL